VIQQNAVDLTVSERTERRSERGALRISSPGMVGAYAILALLAVLYLIPLAFVLRVSLMSSRQFALNAAWLPDPIMWANYPTAWVKGAFSTYFVNSLVYTFAIVAVTLIISTLAAFPIARGHLRGTNVFYIVFLSGILLPVEHVIERWSDRLEETHVLFRANHHLFRPGERRGHTEIVRKPLGGLSL